MKNNMNIDWFNKLKLDIINLVLLFNQIKEETVFMMLTNHWILEDVNLFESFIHLKEMIDVSNNNLDDFVKRICLLDDSSTLFDKSDLKDEFDFIKKNIHLESGFIINMINYMVIITNPFINNSEKVEKLEQYQDIDISCYNQMKINNENLKQLKKERRDLF